MVARLNNDRIAAKPAGSSYRPLRDGTGNSAFDMAQPGQTNAARAAMASFASPGPRGIIAGQTNPAGASNETGPFSSAQVDTSKQDAIADKQNTQSQADRELMTRVGLNTISGLQTRNAENAARMGLASGGASYLSGQRSAAVAGINSFNQGMLGWGQQQQGILGQQAGLASNAASQNASYKQQTGQANTQYGIDKEKNQQDTKSAYYSNELAGIDARAQEQANVFGKDQRGPLQAQYIQLKSAYNRAVSQGDWAQADALLSQLNQLVPARK